MTDRTTDGRKQWSDPVVEDLSVDLDAIADKRGTKAGDGSPGRPNRNTVS